MLFKHYTKLHHKAFGKQAILTEVAGRMINQAFLRKPLVLAVLSAILLVLAWQPFSLFLLAFVGLVPLYFLEEKLRNQSGKFYAYLFLSLLLWNVGSTFWVWNASAGGALAAFILNSILQSTPFMVLHVFRKRIHSGKAEWLFIYAWLAFEYLHLTWDASWPWLTLGNVFSSVPQLVQWYEYTGVFGGSLWILIANQRIYRFIKKMPERSRMMNFSKAFNLIFFVLFAPAFFSWYVLAQYKNTGKPMNVVVVQPNIDPYKDKFEGMTPEEQATKMLKLASTAVDSTVSLVCFPETALHGGLDESQLPYRNTIQQVIQFRQQYPHIQILSGADTYKFYAPGQPHSETARLYSDNLYYDSYNTALFFSNHETIDIYHKSKLVPGVEIMPFPKLFKFLEKLTIGLGGTSGSLGRDSTTRNFDLGRQNLIAPVICYESIYGGYVRDYVKKGAGLICIITNDGWWGNTPGYVQHFDYARLRAIETRRYIARSANTGISGFIDDKGEVLSKSKWWVEDAMKGTVNINSGETFYVTYGDFIAYAAIGLLFLNILVYGRKKEIDINQ